MTDLVARLVAAIQQVRASEPRKCDECYTGGVFWPARHTDACEARWAAKVDVRLAACVEAYGRALWKGAGGFSDDSDWRPAKKAAVAAFLAAAAQERTL